MKRIMLFSVVILVSGCAGTRPLKGGRATTTSKPAGVIEQTVVQSDNPAQVSRQDQEAADHADRS